MAPRRNFVYYETVLTEEDQAEISLCKTKLDEIYSRAHNKTSLLKKQEKKKREADAKKKKMKLELEKEEKRRIKLEKFPENLKNYKKSFLEMVLSKNNEDPQFMEELKSFKAQCTHPKVFETTTKVKEYYETGGGQGPDEVSIEHRPVCGLCRIRTSNFTEYPIQPARLIDIVNNNSASYFKDKVF